MAILHLRPHDRLRTSLIILISSKLQGYAFPMTPRDDAPKKDDNFFLSFVSTILITILAAAILVVFYRYAVKYIPSNTIRIPLKVFSRVGPEGAIRLPTSEEEAARMGETFLNDDNSDEIPDNEGRFHDEDDDDIPPPVTASANTKKVKMTENEEDFFDVSDGEEDIAARTDEGTKVWRD